MRYQAFRYSALGGFKSALMWKNTFMHKWGKRFGSTVLVIILIMYGISFMPMQRPKPFIFDVDLGIKPAAQDTKDFILEGLSRRHEFLMQRAIASIPSSSTYMVSRVTGPKLTRLIDSLFNLGNRTAFLANFFQDHRVSPYGGFIHFDYNLTRFNSFANYRAFVRKTTKEFTSVVHVRYRENEKPMTAIVTIAPIQTADCALSYTAISYCRGPFIEYIEQYRAVHKPTHANDVRLVTDILSLYKQIGLDSTLSPDIDIQTQDDAPRMTDFAIDVTTKLLKLNLIPSPKHFFYLRKFGDLHARHVNVDINSTFLKEAKRPYLAIEAIQSPYFLMVSHHSLSSIDPGVPLTLSHTGAELIRREFPHAVTLCDAITMESLSPLSIRERIRRMTCDEFLTHSGNFIFRGKQILEGLEAVPPRTSNAAVLDMLKLKQHYGLLTISGPRPESPTKHK